MLEAANLDTRGQKLLYTVGKVQLKVGLGSTKPMGGLNWDDGMAF